MLNVLHLFRKYLRATVKATQLIADIYFNFKKRIKKHQICFYTTSQLLVL